MQDELLHQFRDVAVRAMLARQASAVLRAEAAWLREENLATRKDLMRMRIEANRQRRAIVEELVSTPRNRQS